MENNVLKQFSFDYKQIVLDEIALEGLEGIGLDLLWRRIEKRIFTPITEKMRARFWNFVVDSKDIFLYQLPEQAPCLELLDRFSIVDEESGQLTEPLDYLDGPYEFNPIPDEHGSSMYYYTRTLICKDDLRIESYEQVIADHGNTLVLVASITTRWHALAPHMPISCLKQISPVHYCILELVGKGRENGQITLGKSNLLKIVRDSKQLFYNRSYLQKLDFIRVQCITQIVQGRGVKSILLRLKRFHQPLILSMPKKGKLHDVFKYLLEQPDFSQRADVIIKKGFLNNTLMKRLQKTVNIFNFEDRNVISENASTKKNKPKNLEVKRRFITLSSLSDESSQSEGEGDAEPLKCEYKVGVNLLRQAYERFLDAGRKGCTQIELAELLGVEFYTARTICRTLKLRNIVREFMEDRGKQRAARYIAVSATGEMNVKYEEEKKKFLGFLSDSQANKRKPEDVSQSSTEVPKKKLKVEEKKEDINLENMLGVDSKTIEKDVTEVKVIDGLENSDKFKSLLCSKKAPTLRQLRFANGILTAVREKLAISGYQPLSQLVSKEIDETPLDTKPLKTLVQKLVSDGQLKLLKMKWPTPVNRYSILICAPHVKSSDPIIKAKYKEISAQVMRNRKMLVKKSFEDTIVSMTQFTYPRYLRIQKLHELIIKIVYFRNVESTISDLPEGFCSLGHIIPELTVEFAMAIIGQIAASSESRITQDMYHVKLKNVPIEVFKMFLVSSNLQNCIKMNLKAIAMLGLIQLTNDLSQHYVYYVNRRAKIYDTTGVWPRQVAETDLIQKSYVFNTSADVESYWNDVYNTSTKTTIELTKRGRKQLSPPIRSSSEVQENDNGQFVGDGLGPCGFDSLFFMDVPRLWCTYYSKVKKMQEQLPKKAIIKVPKRAKKKSKPIKKNKKPISKPIIKIKPHVKLTRRRKGATVKWTMEEDKIIMFCKAAITIMSPFSQAGCLRLRNMVCKEIVSLIDPYKTRSACHLRAIAQELNPSSCYEKECLLNDFRRRENLFCQYDGLLKKLRLQYPGNFPKQMFEGQLPMMQLVWLMSQIYESKSFNLKMPCIAMDFADFQRNFTITSFSNKSCNLYRTTTEFEPCLTAIKEGVILAVMQTFLKELTQDVAQVVLTMFKAYTDQNLRIAVDHLRKSGAIAVKERFLNPQFHKFNFTEVVQSYYKISANYKRKWICRLNSDFVEEIAESLEMSPSQNDLKGRPDFNCIFCELHTCDALDMVLGTASVVDVTGSLNSILQEQQLTVCDVETKYKLKAGSNGWKSKINVKTLSEIYRDIEFDDFQDLFTRSTIKPVIRGDAATNDIITSHLDAKKQDGSTFHELQNVTGYDTKTLISKLERLESKNIIARAGYYENVIVLTEYSLPWTINVGGENILPTPWLTIENKIRYDIFLRWAGVILNKVFESPGCSVSYLSNACEFLTAKGTQDICVFLEKCKCVTLKVARTPELDLFSDDEVMPEIQEFNCYESVHNIIIFPVINSLSRYACLRKKMLDEYSEDS